MIGLQRRLLCDEATHFLQQVGEVQVQVLHALSVAWSTNELKIAR